MIRFSVLGQLSIQDGDVERHLAAARQRAVLAVLISRAETVVPAEKLVEHIWGDTVRDGSRAALHTTVMRLRKALGPRVGALVQTHPAGYLLDLTEARLDLRDFGNLHTRGRASLADGDLASAYDLFQQALSLWRGEPFADITPEVLPGDVVPALRHARLQAIETCASIDITWGRASSAVAVLRPLVATHPAREGLHDQLMRALHQLGHRGEALEVYRDFRATLHREYGVEPGEQMRATLRRILAGDAETTPPSPTTAVTSPAEGPRQLPSDLRDFTGRAHDLAQLLEVAEPMNPDAVPVAIVCGPGGIGKTSLAVRAAHRLSGSYPDGQLFLELRGASANPLPPADALRRLLRDLGGDDHALSDVDELAAAYRSRMATRRMLLVLDDARDAAQVRPLIPGYRGCLVLVTSRNQLASLPVSRRIELGTLSEAEAHEVFDRIAGRPGPGTDPGPVERIVNACKGLPLALRIAAARLASEPDLSPGALAARLADTRRILNELAVDDLAVRASIDVSYRALTDDDSGPGTAEVFRLLGLWDGTTHRELAVAALVGQPVERVRPVLEQLVDANLIGYSAEMTYRLHDLVRAFALERAHAEMGIGECRSAVRRLVDWHLRSWDAATRVLAQQRRAVELDPVDHEVTLPAFDSYADALAWCNSERGNVITAIRQAADHAQHDLAWKLAVVACRYYNRVKAWADWQTSHEIALASAAAAGDTFGQAWVLTNLGGLCGQQGAPEAALRHLEDALRLRRSIGDKRGEALTLCNTALIHRQLDDRATAIGYLTDAVDAARAVADRYVEGVALSNLGEVLRLQGDLDEAVRRQREALVVLRAIGDRNSEAFSLDMLGEVARDRGNYAEALDYYQQSLLLRRELGYRHGEALVYNNMGLTWAALGNREKAVEHWRVSLAIFEELEAVEAAEVRANLARFAG